MLLALDTATRDSGIALYQEDTLVAELNWRSADSQTTELMPRLAQMLAWHNLSPANLSGLAVSLGPGSFTGLRIALSAAKGLALAHNLPLVGVPTLDATAYPHLGLGGPVCALVQAGRGRVCWAIYSRDQSLPMEDREAIVLGQWSGWRSRYHLSGIEQLAAFVQTPICVVGEVAGATTRHITEALGDLAQVAPLAAARRRTGALAELGWIRLRAGDADDAASLSPLYLREP